VDPKTGVLRGHYLDSDKYNQIFEKNKKIYENNTKSCLTSAMPAKVVLELHEDGHITLPEKTIDTFSQYLDFGQSYAMIN